MKVIKGGRGSRGTFAKGNTAAKGRRSPIADHRAAIREAITPDDIVRVLQALLRRATDARWPCVHSAQLLLAHVVGKPATTIRVDPVDDILPNWDPRAERPAMF